MPQKSGKAAPSSEGATMDSLRRGAGQLPDFVQPQDLDSTEVALSDEGIEGVLVDPDREAAQRAAQFVMTRGYKPNTIELVRWIAGSAVDTSDLNAVIIEQMAIRMANAESADDILDPFGTVKGQDLLDKPLWVTGAEFLESDMAEGFPWYASFQVTDQRSGKSKVVTVGGEKLVMQAAAMTRNSLWPAYVMIHKSDKPTKGGFYPLELRPSSPTGANV